MRTLLSRALPMSLLAVLAAAAAIHAGNAPRMYGLDEDPIRLGTKALAEGRWADARARFDEAIANAYKVDQAKYGLAEIAVREGHPEQAEGLYREAIGARKSEFAEARAGLGLVLLGAGRDKEAAAEFDRALTDKPDLWDAVYGRARVLLNEGKPDEAKSLLAKGAKKKGVKEGEDKYHHGMALAHMAQGDLAGAEPEALLAMHLNPTQPEYGALVAKVYEAMNQPGLAIEAYERVLATPSAVKTAPMLHALGRLYQKTDHYTEARDRYLQAVDVDSTYAPALRDLGDVFRLAKQPEKSARVYLRYLLAQPDDVDARVHLAECYLELGQYAPAADAAREAATRDSTRTDVRFALARAGVRSTDAAMRSHAADVFVALPDSLPWTADDYVALASVQMEAKQTEAAQQSLTRALTLDPKLPDAHFQQGLLEMSAGRPDSAIAAFERAVSARPDAPLYHLNLGIAYYQAKRLGDSIPAFRKALELRPELTSGRLLLAQALAVSDSVGAAEKEYRRVLEAEPANAKALRGLAFCYIRAADYKGAVDAYEKAAKAEPGNADGWAGLGNAYLGLSNWDAAEKAFDKARAIDPSNATLRKGVELLNRAKAQGSSG